MTFFYARFLIAWACWLFFADKSRWKELVPVCVFASSLSLITDQVVDYIPYWKYYGSEPEIVITLIDEFDINPIATYLFIQWLPQK